MHVCIRNLPIYCFISVPEYEIVNPVAFSPHTRRRRNIEWEEETKDIKLTAFGEDYHMRLQENTKLLAENLMVDIHNENGTIVRTPLKSKRCFYHGTLLSHNISSIAVSTCKGLVCISTFRNRSQTLDRVVWCKRIAKHFSVKNLKGLLRHQAPYSVCKWSLINDFSDFRSVTYDHSHDRDHVVILIGINRCAFSRVISYHLLFVFVLFLTLLIVIICRRHHHDHCHSTSAFQCAYGRCFVRDLKSLSDSGIWNV